jgi:hypothetical protein
MFSFYHRFSGSTSLSLAEQDEQTNRAAAPRMLIFTDF